MVVQVGIQYGGAEKKGEKGEKTLGTSPVNGGSKMGIEKEKRESKMVGGRAKAT